MWMVDGSAGNDDLLTESLDYHSWHFTKPAAFKHFSCLAAKAASWRGEVPSTVEAWRHALPGVYADAASVIKGTVGTVALHVEQ